MNGATLKVFLVVLCVIGGATGLWMVTRSPVDSPKTPEGSPSLLTLSETAPPPSTDAPGTLADVDATGTPEPISEQVPDPSPTRPAKRKNPSVESKSRNSKPTLRDAMPSQETYRAEAIEDPHMAPKSIVGFASQMADRMEKALGSEAEAKALFPELSSCARAPKEQTPVSTRALCFTNARRLAAKFHALGPDMAKLTSSVEPNVLQLSDSLR